MTAFARDGRRIALTDHLFERGELRLDLPPAQLARMVVDEVDAAIGAGRIAKTLPRTFGRPRRKVNDRLGKRRVAWSPDESRAFILLRTRDAQGPLWLVMTVLTVQDVRAWAPR